jgi:hypothetical protein
VFLFNVVVDIEVVTQLIKAAQKIQADGDLVYIQIIE